MCVCVLSVGVISVLFVCFMCVNWVHYTLNHVVNQNKSTDQCVQKLSSDLSVEDNLNEEIHLFCFFFFDPRVWCRMQLDTSVCMLVLHVRNTNSNSKLWQTQVSTEYVKIKIKKLNMKLLSCVSLAVCMFKTENKMASIVSWVLCYEIKK